MFATCCLAYYWVSEATVDGWYHTTPTMVPLLVISGSHIVDIKFGNVPYTCFNGYKVEDMNGNGRWDDDELGPTRLDHRGRGRPERRGALPPGVRHGRDGYWETCYNMLPGTYWMYEMRA